MKRILLALSLLAAVSMAQAQSYTSTLNGPNAGNATTGTGFGTLSLTGTMLSYDVNYTGLTGAPIAAHVHHGSGGVTSINPFGTLTAGAGQYQGTMSLTPQQAADIVAQTSYLNIHTPTFPGGEIRGDIVVVPEPSTIGLLGAAGLLLAWRKFRARA